MRVLLPALLLLGACVSSKDKIERAVSASDERASAIVAEATAAEAEIAAASQLDLPEEARPSLDSAGLRQGRIIEHATGIRGDNNQAREGLGGVIDRPKPLWLKALIAGLVLVALGAALLAFAPGLVVRLIPSLASILGRSRLSGAHLLQQGKTTEAIAAMRASDRRFDAAWREAKR